MEITGTLVYDPVVRATGKDRARVIRRHAHVLAVCVRAYVPYLEGRERRIANQFDKLLHDDPNYWVRRKGSNVCTAKHLNQLLDHARDLRLRREHPEFSLILVNTLNQIEDELILTRQDPGWAILKIDLSVLTPYLDEIRADGTAVSCSAWGPHCTVMRGEGPTNHALWGKYEGQEFQITTSDELRSNKAGYYWLNAQSRALENVRTELGLPPRPRPPFHLTIGKKC
jgi:hypothetical protein